MFMDESLGNNDNNNNDENNSHRWKEYLSKIKILL